MRISVIFAYQLSNTQWRQINETIKSDCWPSDVELEVIIVSARSEQEKPEQMSAFQVLGRKSLPCLHLHVGDDDWDFISMCVAGVGRAHGDWIFIQNGKQEFLPHALSEMVHEIMKWADYARGIVCVNNAQGGHVSEKYWAGKSLTQHRHDLERGLRLFKRSWISGLLFEGMGSDKLLASVSALPWYKIRHVQAMHDHELEKNQEFSVSKDPTSERLYCLEIEFSPRSNIARQNQYGLKEAPKAEAMDQSQSTASINVDPQQTLRNIEKTESIECWLEKRMLFPSEQKLAREYLATHQGGPSIGVLLLGGGPENTSLTNRTKISLKQACILGINASIVELSPSSEHGSVVGEINAIATSDQFDWLLVVNAGDEFTPQGLWMVVQGLIEAPMYRAIYADEIYRLPDGQSEGVFRPDFNLDLLLSHPKMMAAHWFFRCDAIVNLGGFDKKALLSFEFDMILRLVTEGGSEDLGHVHEPLLYCEQPALKDSPSEKEAISRFLVNRGYDNAHVESVAPGLYRIIYGHEHKPLVSIIIPTKDQVHIMHKCLDALLNVTKYPNYEVIIVDNDSQTQEAQEWLGIAAGMQPDRIRVLRYSAPFNFSEINNLAAIEAKGDYLLLLNNDTVVLEPDWLDAMMNHAQRPEVAAVGAKLHFPNLRIQNAGVILGLRGVAEPAHLGSHILSPGQHQRLLLDQNCSALSGSCLLVKKSLYMELGGLNDEQLQTAYNDVDFCLRAAAAGYLNVWTPHARLIHLGGLTRGRQDIDQIDESTRTFSEAQEWMLSRWLPVIANDPAYNRNLSLHGKGFEVESDAHITWRPLGWRPLPVVFAGPADRYGCGHYRVIQPFEAMRQAALVDGMLADRYLTPAEFGRLDPDVIVLQRQTDPQQLQLLKKMKTYSKAFKVYELDDYLPGVPVKSAFKDNISKDILKRLRQGVAQMDRFIVSTNALAEALDGLHPDIQVVELRLPPVWWGDLKNERQENIKPRFGWAGGGGHRGDLEMVADVIREFSEEVDWVFFGMCPDALRPYVKEFHAGVDIEKYPAKLSSLNLDLAIAPLEDNLFNRCKSNLRLLEYGACGIPVVASAVRPYVDSQLPVTLVKNRYIDWVRALRDHLHDLKASRRLGDELHEQIRNKWMLEGENLQLWVKAWTQS